MVFRSEVVSPFLNKKIEGTNKEIFGYFELLFSFLNSELLRFTLHFMKALSNLKNGTFINNFLVFRLSKQVHKLNSERMHNLGDS